MENNQYALLSEQIKALTTMTNAQFINVNERLDKINGRVQKHEDAITLALIERSANRQKQEDYFMEIDSLDKRMTAVEKLSTTHATLCPNIDKIRKLEDESISNKSIRKFSVFLFTGGIAIGGLVVGIIKLIIG